MKGIKFLPLVIFIVLGFFTSTSYAVVSLFNGKLELEGTLYHQSIMRNEDFSHKSHYVQGRNSGEFEILYHLVDDPSQAFCIFDKIDLFTIFRAGYDNVYDFSDRWGADAGYFSKKKESDLKTESYLREWYVDLYKGKLWLRLGRQQIVWGKSDFFRLLDIINPMDYSWHYFFESFEDIRIPLRMALAQYSFGRVGFFESLSVQLVVNPEDVKPTYTGRFGEPWALAPPGFEFYPQYKPHGAQFGGRVQAMIGGFSFTINDYYTYQQLPVFDLFQGRLEYPRVNIVGGAVDYYDDFTSSVLRAELTYTPNKKMGIDFTNPNSLNLLGKNFPHGMPERDEIKYVIGVDRPTWIKCLNKKNSFFLSAQLFMTHVLNHEPAITNDGVAVKPTEQIITFLANTVYGNRGQLTPQVYWAYSLHGDAHVIGPSVNYLINDNWAVKVGANIIWGRETRYANFGSVRDNDELYTRIQFTF